MNPYPALLGTVANVLYPADTTHPFLTHALGSQPALTMLLLAGYAVGRLDSFYL